MPVVWEILKQNLSWSDQKICEKKYTKWLDYDRIKYDISVRTRKTGDYLTVNSQGHRKKLTRCMIDEKIPANRGIRFL
ncbi:MAG: tRNA lysidine(34) synthetase TilS [Lachnospiraceae bacterium]